MAGASWWMFATTKKGVIVLCNGMPIHWRSQKQPDTSISSAQAEIYALSEAVKDAKLRCYVSEEMGASVEWPCKIYVDNSAGVSFQKATTPNTKLKGVFDLRWWWVKELQDKSVIQAVKVDTAKNVAELFTKCLPGCVFKKLLQCVRERALSIAQRK